MLLPDGDWIAVAQAVVCYLGVVLYGSVLSVPGRRPGLSAYIVFFYAGLFPLPEDTRGFLVQEVLLGLVFASFGAHILCLHLQSAREVRAMEAGRLPSPLPRRLRILVHLPALLVVGAFLVAAVSGGRAGFRRLDRAAHAATMAVVAAYMGTTWVVGRRWLSKVGDVRLLETMVSFNRLNLGVALLAAVLALGFLVRDPGSTEGRVATVVALAAGLLPVAIEVRSIVDAVLRRLIALHVMIAIVAGVVFGVPAILGALDLGALPIAAATLAGLAVAALALPARIDRAVEAWLFPRATLMRARLAEIATEPPAAATRAEAGERLLRRVVEVLDGEGGIVVLDATAAEPASVRTCGRADAGPLGPTAADAVVTVSRLGLHGDPRRVDLMPLADRLLLLRCETIVACPLRAGRLEGMLLLGPRRGWPYDAGAEQALRAFGSQAGLALANLTLAAGRLRSEKLAALGEAAARIAHEIRNPLAGARSLVQQAASTDGAAPLLAPALDELDRIGRLVRDLLAFARVDDRRASEPVDLEEVCRRACAQLAGVAAASGVELDVDLVPTPVVGDPERLVQVVANLARNGIEAVAATDARPVTVRARPEGPLATVEVRDGGPGIAAAELPRLFDPFRTSKPEGTGLGLAIARRIVDAHGGRLVVTSVPGVVTVFRVELPLAATASRSGPRASRAPA